MPPRNDRFHSRPRPPAGAMGGKPGIGNRPRNDRGGNGSSNGRVSAGEARNRHAKYLELARQAKVAGDEVGEQTNLQYAEHWYRTANAERVDMAETNSVQPHLEFLN
jgi:hypothetical protein